MTAQTSRTLCVALIAVIFALYVRHYMLIPAEKYVMQTGVDGFRSGMLSEKQPIVIEDRVYDATPLAKDAFRYQHLWCTKARWKKKTTAAAFCINRTTASATFVSPKACTEDRCVVRAECVRRTKRSKRSNASKTEEADQSGADNEEGEGEGEGEGEIGFVLRTSQVLVLPPHWRVRCDEDVAEVDVVRVYDGVHLLLHPFFA